MLFLRVARIDRISFATAQAVFWGYAALMGLSLAGLLLVYTGIGVAFVFFITAGTFAAMSAYGYSTGRDLSRFGAFLVMGLIGIVLGKPGEHIYRFRRLAVRDFGHRRARVHRPDGIRHAADEKGIYLAGGFGADLAKTALMGALTLYLDFINLFVMLLQLTGDRRGR